MQYIPIHKIPYTSSVDGTGPLYADMMFSVDGRPKPLLVVMHGFGGDRALVSQDIHDLAARGLFCIAPDMRGRGESAGKFDACGLDVHDILDAILEAIRMFPGEIDTRNINICGYSGGGGNSFAAFARFPDLFHVIAPFFGIADFGAWHRLHETYDKMLDDIFGGTPEQLPLNYAARNFTLAAANNPSARLHIFWDEEEKTCDPVMNEDFIKAYRAAGHDRLTVHLSKKDDAVRWLHGYRTDHPLLAKGDDIIVKEIFSSPADNALPSKGTLTVCGYVVTKDFQVFIEDGQRGVVKIAYDLTGATPEVTVVENPDNLPVNISLDTPLAIFK
ncbi:MAG: alpha/beta hydrolase [Chthoniobacterales bacterium]